MTGFFLCRAAGKGRVHGKRSAVRGRLGPMVGSLVLASLLLGEVAAAMVGGKAVFFSTIVTAWLVLMVVVGPKNVLDAGCFYMLISLGIVVVVDVVRYGPISLLAQHHSVAAPWPNIHATLISYFASRTLLHLMHNESI